MNVVASKRSGSKATSVPSVQREESLDELCKRANFLVVAAPATESTRGQIDERRLALLPPGAIVCVISRGGIVDEEALADAIESGRLGGASVDSTAVEPLPPASRLWTLPSVLLTPHSSALSSELFERRRVIFEQQLARFLRGEPLQNTIDMVAAF